VGLKPHAPTEKHKACIFPQPVQPLIFLALLTWAFGPGWYRSRLWRWLCGGLPAHRKKTRWTGARRFVLGWGETNADPPAARKDDN